MAAMAPRWLFKKAFHCFVGSGFLGAFRIHLQLAMNTRRSPGWVSATMRKISSRVSLLTHFRPARALCRERHVQYSLKPARCQATTVSGWTMTSARFHPGQNRRNTTQKTLSGAVSLGRECPALKTLSCCRKARISSSNSRREHKLQAIRPMNSLSVRSIHGVVSEKMPRKLSPDPILASHSSANYSSREGPGDFQ